MDETKLSHLPAAEDDYEQVLHGEDIPARKTNNKKKKRDTEPASFFSLFTFAEPIDVFLIIVGVVGGFCLGTSMPLQSLFLGEMTKVFAALDNGVDHTTGGLVNSVSELSLIFVYIAIGSCFVGFFAMAFPTWAAERQMLKCRVSYFRAIMHQDIAWFDTNNPEELATRLAADVNEIQEGIGDKLSLLVQQLFGQFVGGFVLCFIRSWQMALVMLGISPILGSVLAVMVKLIIRYTQQVQTSYAKAGAVAEEVFSNVRTVHSYNTIDREERRYQINLAGSRAIGLKKAFLQGFCMGLLFFVMYGSYALAFWWGTWLIQHHYKVSIGGEYITGGDILSCFFCVLMGSFGLGSSLPQFGTIATARGAAGSVMNVLHSTPAINPFSHDPRKALISLSSPSPSSGPSFRAPLPNTKDNGGSDGQTVGKPAFIPIQVPEKGGIYAIQRGDLELRGVTFAYPSRPDIKVLEDFSLQIQGGTAVALIGGSGCGKSTIISMFQRWYDPDAGDVFVDGVNVKDFDVTCLRSQMALVGQEPTLFATSIAENITLGLDYDVSEEEIENACKQANIHTFIQTLPDRYDTFCGEGGVQMSGGQKQRISIARALIRKPKILLLDEATSALDNESERIVQNALDDIARTAHGLTIIMIAHRLTTVRNADRIVVLDRGGIVVESGSHDELIARNGKYVQMLLEQSIDPSSAACASVSHHASPCAPGPVVTPTAPAPFGPRNDASAPDVELIPCTSPVNGTSHPLGHPANSGQEISSSSPTAQTTTADNKKKKEQKGHKGKEDEKDKEKNQSKEDVGVPFSWIIANSRHEWPSLLLGCIGSMVTGACMPVFGLVFSEVIEILYYCDVVPANETLEECHTRMMNLEKPYFGYFVAIGVGILLASTVQHYFLNRAGENITERLRVKLFKGILRQDISYFDDPANTVGALTTQLSTDVTYINQLFNMRLGQLFQSFFALAVAFIISFINSWLMTLVVVGSLPIMASGQALRHRQIARSRGASDATNEKFKEAGGLAQRSIAAIRTVVSLNGVDAVVKMYAKLLEAPFYEGRKNAIMNGIFYGYSSLAQFSVYALVVWFGGWVIQHDYGSLQQVMAVFFSLTMASFAAAQAASLAPDLQKAQEGIRRIYLALTILPTIDKTGKKGQPHPEAECSGHSSLRNVKFRFPQRKLHGVLDGITADFPTQRMTAMVGSSGCGKSTIMALLMRHYDVNDGVVTHCGHDVRALKVTDLRYRIAIVSQEPRLFRGTVQANIRYGRPTATPDEVIAAAKAAHIHDFIMSKLPQGYQTPMWQANTQFSGGEKQRIAIARALLMKPRMLFLDEATSALDTGSEKEVQKALDEITSNGELTIVCIAHRLSTIQNAHQILFVKDGKISEVGTHQELLEKGGDYANLATRSDKDKDKDKEENGAPKGNGIASKSRSISEGNEA